MEHVFCVDTVNQFDDMLVERRRVGLLGENTGKVFLHHPDVRSPLGLLHRKLARKHQVVLKLAESPLFQDLQGQFLVHRVEDVFFLHDELQNVAMLCGFLEFFPIFDSLDLSGLDVL